MPRVLPSIPTKPLRTCDLARAAGVSLGTVRRLERRGLLRAVRDYRNWRCFAPAEVERLRELLGWKVLEPPA
jgi:DNA-binding transcriptional MerR regulator